MLRFPDRSDALPLNLIWNFETTSRVHSPGRNYFFKKIVAKFIEYFADDAYNKV